MPKLRNGSKMTGQKGAGDQEMQLPGKKDSPDDQRRGIWMWSGRRIRRRK